MRTTNWSKCSPTTQLAFHHAAGMHNDIPHPLCPVCEQHRVNRTRVIDSVDADEVERLIIAVEPRTMGFQDIRDEVDNAQQIVNSVSSAVLDVQAQLRLLEECLGEDIPENVNEALEQTNYALSRICTDHTDELVGELNDKLKEISKLADTAEEEAEEQEEALKELNKAVEVLR